MSEPRLPPPAYRLPPTGHQNDHRDEQSRTDDRPEEGKRRTGDVDQQRLGQAHPAGDPRAEQRPDEAERDGDQAASVRAARDRPADRSRDRRDQQIDEQ